VFLAGGWAAPSDHPRVDGVPSRVISDPDPGQGNHAQPAPVEVGSTLAISPERAIDAGDGAARVAPRVEAVQPAGSLVPVYASIVATFSEPMARASVEQSFEIRPAAEGQVTWLDDFTLRFEPFRLAHDVTYEVEVGGRSARGVPLAGPRMWRFTTVAAPPLVLAPGPSAIRVPIVTYHYIRVNWDPRDRMGFALSVTPWDFASQMDWLARNGYHPINLEDLNAYLTGTRGLPSRPVVLTFDDGYADFYTAALPILRAHDFTSVAYVVSGFVGRPGYMTAAQVLAADRMGVEIGSHTVDHVDLTRQSGDGMRYQLAESKAALERLLGHAVLSFCYPYGRSSPGATASVQAAGYRDATSTQFGFVHTLADRYTWTRLRITGGEGLDQFALALLSAS